MLTTVTAMPQDRRDDPDDALRMKPG